MSRSKRVGLFLIVPAFVIVAAMLWKHDGRDSDLPFLSDYRYENKGMVRDYNGNRSRELLWFHAPYNKVLDSFASLRLEGFSECLGDSFDCADHTTDEAWIIVQGQATFAHWPNPESVVLPGTEKDWTTVLYRRPDSQFLDVKIQRFLNL